MPAKTQEGQLVGETILLVEDDPDTARSLCRALEASGYRMLGTSTSGQAARNLGEEAHIESRTFASLNW